MLLSAPNWIMGLRSMVLLDSHTPSCLIPTNQPAYEFVTGAFRTSPAISYCAETSLTPLSYWRLAFAAKLLCSIENNLSLAVYNNNERTPKKITHHPAVPSWTVLTSCQYISLIITQFQIPPSPHLDYFNLHPSSWNSSNFQNHLRHPWSFTASRYH